MPHIIRMCVYGILKKANKVNYIILRCKVVMIIFQYACHEITARWPFRCRVVWRKWPLFTIWRPSMLASKLAYKKQNQTKHWRKTLTRRKGILSTLKCTARLVKEITLARASSCLSDCGWSVWQSLMLFFAFDFVADRFMGIGNAPDGSRFLFEADALSNGSLQRTSWV